MAKVKTMTDAQGNTIPLKYISAFDKDCDALALDLQKIWEDEHKRLTQIAARAMEKINGLAEKYLHCEGGRGKGAKGNYSFTAFDGSVKVTLREINRIVFDARIQRARELIYEMIKAKTAGGIDADILELVNNAFTPRADGMLSNGRIFGLMRLQIKDKRWQEAMEVLREAIKVTGTRPLIYVEQRQGDGSYRPIKLDIAECYGA